MCVTLLLFYVQIDKKKLYKKKKKKELSYDVAELKIRLVHINKGIIPKYIYIYIYIYIKVWNYYIIYDMSS